jgi:hypothetical protein
LLVAAAVAGLVATTFAQGTNFAGTWVRDAGAAPAGGGGGGAAGGGGGGGGQGRGGGGGGGVFACGAECTIVQDAKTLTIKRPAPAQGGNAPADLVLNLTGPSKLMAPGRGGAEPTPYEANAKWDGAKWVVTRTLDMQGTSITATQTISIEAGKLTVVSTSTREGAMPQTQTYTKK